VSRTVYYTATTLDGFIADPHDSLDWLLTQPHDPDGPFGYQAFIADVGALCMGATTYRWILDHLAGTGGAWEYPVPTFVLTHRTFPTPDDADVRFRSGDVRAVHAAMTEAAGGQDLWVVGGGDLAGQLADVGLLDEVVVSIAPVTLGAGRPLLPRRHDLELVDLGRNGAFACARYRVVGPRAPLAERPGDRP
jgi:dihydrofolate reductase